jgi:hypothetical protein
VPEQRAGKIPPFVFLESTRQRTGNDLAFYLRLPHPRKGKSG